MKAILKHKKIVAILIVFLILAGLYALSSFIPKPKTPSTPVTPFSTTISIAPEDETPKILKTEPRDKQEYVLVDSNITITFVRPLFEENKAFLTITTEPETKPSLTWAGNAKLSINPSDQLNTETAYTVKVIYKQQSLHTFTFTTNLYTPEQLDEQAEIQAQDDLLFGSAFNKVIQDYPWYPRLPIDTEKYTITYDFEIEAFKIKIKTPNPNEEEKDNIVKDALERLKAIGVDTEKINYYTL